MNDEDPSRSAAAPRRAPNPFDEIPVEEWDRLMAVNLRGTWLCCTAVAPVFRQQGSGVIINISSGTIYFGAAGLMHDVTSKAAVWGMTGSWPVSSAPPGCE